MNATGFGSFSGYTLSMDQAQCLFDASNAMSITDWQTKVSSWLTDMTMALWPAIVT